MVCNLPLVSHHNYKNDEDHDRNTRKYWFVVFGVGLFTAQKDALQASGTEDGVHVFITCNQATRAWARHCRRRHTPGCHKTQDPKAHPSDADSNTDGDAPAKRRQTPVNVKQEKKPVMRPSTVRAALVPVKRAAYTPAPTLPVKRAAHTPAATVPVKRALEVHPPSPEKKRSLYADVEDDDDGLVKSDSSTDDDLLKSDSSIDVPLAKSLAASRLVHPARG
ncbi:hypothetical protein B0H14DRAFT_3454085 [Mycena olivaceomarginata]|nr:hypothetical protein B0H14DRAFT_3454085 [Mycena olivaceomarginata]